MASIRPDDRLSVHPVSLMFDGEYVRESTVKTRQNYHNLVKDPRIAISVPHRNNPNRYVEIRGIAELTDDPDRTFIDSVARHYMQVDVYPFNRPGGERVTITIHAEQVPSPAVPLADAPPSAADPGYRV